MNHKIIFRILISLFFLACSEILCAQCTEGNCNNGNGTYKYANGQYTGEFKNGLRHGSGTYVYTDGNKFVGTYENGEKYYGTFYYKSGSTYTGYFKNDKRNGYGKAVSADGTVKEGEWKDGEYVGPVNPEITYAVVVGISDYYGNSMDLVNADNDAVDFYNFLLGHGSIKSNTILLTNSGASKAAIISAVALFSKADSNDKIVFFFSGHGYKNGFVPSDYNGIFPLLGHSIVRNAFKNSIAGTKLCIADACFSGNIRTDDEDNNEDDQGTFDKNDQIAVFMSSRSYQTSSDGNIFSGNGLFTGYLLKGLDGSADSDKDNIVTIYELYSYVRQMVVAESPSQVPVLFGNFDKNLVMSKIK